MTKEYVQMVGRAAYFWGYPLVATSNRRAAFCQGARAHPLGGGRTHGPGGLQHDAERLHQAGSTFIVCPNQDVVYGGGLPRWTRSRRYFRCRTSATASGFIRCTTRARMRLPDWQAIRQQARLLHDRRAELEGRGPGGHHHCRAFTHGLVFAIPRIQRTTRPRTGKPSSR